MASNKYSDLKIIHFPDKLKSFRKGVISAPIYVRVKPINLCNHHCWWCVYHAPEMSQMHKEMEVRDRIPKDKLIELLDDFADIGVKALTFSGGGEPLIHPDIVQVMQHTLDNGIDLSIITNGSMLKGERAEVLAHAKWVRVSMDYSCADELHRFRHVDGKQFNEIIDNIRNFAKIKHWSCDLYVNFIVHADNCSRLFTFSSLLKECGVQNVRFSPMWVSPGFHEYHRKIAVQVQEQLDQIRDKLADKNFSVNTTYDLMSSAHNSFRTYHRCYFMQIVPVVGADLNVYACHNKAYDQTGAIGSIKDRTFSNLWFSDEAKAKFDGLDPIRDCCHQCANDSKNHLIHEIMETSVDNFV